MPEGSFSVKDLGVVIARALGLRKGETVEVQKDKTNPNRVLVLRHPGAQEEKS
jgi:hypothetical protein